MFSLNLPSFTPKIKETDGKHMIFDPIRKKYITLTPEEWVRQHFVNYLIVNKGFPSGRMSNECNINLNGLKRRCDTVLYDLLLKPLVIIEFKAPDVTITQAVFDQAARYNSVLKAPYLVITNGLVHHACKIDFTKANIEYLNSLPLYSEMISNP